MARLFEDSSKLYDYLYRMKAINRCPVGTRRVTERLLHDHAKSMRVREVPLKMCDTYSLGSIRIPQVPDKY